MAFPCVGWRDGSDVKVMIGKKYDRQDKGKREAPDHGSDGSIRPMDTFRPGTWGMLSMVEVFLRYEFLFS